MNLKLPDSISSPQDLVAVILEIRDYTRWFSHRSIIKRVSKKRTSEPPVMSPAATELLRECSAKKPLSQLSLGKLIKTLEKFQSTAPTLTITLAAPPTSDIKRTLVAWCRENIAPNVAVTFQFNATLLGGMVVRSGSHIYDWSFRRQILANRAKFPEVLRRV